MKSFMKKLLAFAIAVAIVLPTTVVAVQAETTPTEEETKHIQILQTSDIHGRFMPFKYATYSEDYSGSLAQLATLIKENRTENSILMDVGDTIQDNSSDIFFDDDTHPMMLGFNMLNYDYWCVGNHEFNYGVDVLKKVMKQFDGTVFCGNVYDTDGETKLADTYDITERDGVKIAVIGMVTPNITKWDAANLEGYTVTNPIDEVKAAIAEVKDQVDVIVVACHMDPNNEFDVYGSGAYDLAEECPEIDVICAAHGHRLVTEHYDNESNTLICENLSTGQSINNIDIEVKSDGNGGYDVVSTSCETLKAKDVAVDEEVGDALEPYNERAKEDALQPVGTLTGGDLVNTTEIPGITQSQIEESAMMNLINDVQMFYSGADCSAAAILSDVANIKEGDIRKCDTANIYKYDNTLYKLQMTGAQLKQYMEWSVSYYQQYKEGDLTFAFNTNMASYLYDTFGGLKYDVNISKEVGSRIENLCKADGTPIKDDDIITIAVNNYRANSQLLSAGVVFEEGNLPTVLEKDCQAGIAIRDLITKYIQEEYNGTINAQDFIYGNWKLTGYDWNQAKHDKVAELVNAGEMTVTRGQAITEADLAAYNAKMLKTRESSVGTVKVASSTSLKVTYDAVENADGYKVIYSTSAKFSSFKGITTTKTAATITGLTPGKTYYVKVLAYAENGAGKRVYADADNAKSATTTITLSKPVVTLKAATKAMTVSYKKIAYAQSYKIQYTTDKNFKKSVKTVTTTATSKTIKKLTSKKTYYVKVTAIAKAADGKTYTSKVSAVKSVKVK